LETEHVGLFRTHETLYEIDAKPNRVDIPRSQSEPHDHAC
jgi:hypothetical protein